MRTRKLQLECKNCDHQFEASYYAGCPGSYFEPPDPEELEIPEECPHCNLPLHEEDYLEQAQGLCAPPED